MAEVRRDNTALQHRCTCAMSLAARLQLYGRDEYCHHGNHTEAIFLCVEAKQKPCTAASSTQTFQ
jgi:hypothetical protein